MKSTREAEYEYIDGLLQDCSISSALAIEILQSWTKTSIYGKDKVSLTSYEAV